MTIINPNSISGISSITALNSTAAINLFKDDGTAANIITGITTGTNFKTGSSNLHSVGIEIAGINVLGADTPIGAGATIYNSGAAVFTGIVTATNLDISGDIDVDGHTNLDNVNIAGVTTTTGNIHLNSTDKKIYLTSDYDQYITANAASNYMVFATANSPQLRISSNGDMGLGTETPNTYSNQTVFTINGTTYGRLDLEVGGTLRGSLWANSGGLGLDAGGNDIEMFTGSQQRVKINTSGQMGIGQGFSPSRHLDIKDSTGANRIVNIRGTGTSGAFLAFLDANTTDDSKCRIGSIGGNSIGMRGDAHHFQDGGGNNKVVINSSGSLIVGAASYGAAGSFSVGANGTFRSILASGTAQDTLIAGISGVSNGFQVTTDASNNQVYKFHNGTSQALTITDNKTGVLIGSPFSRFQCGSHTFSGGHGMYADSRVGMSNHGSLTGLMLASTYNDATHPEYGVVFVQGPTTSSYNVWSISPDGPAKGDSLNLHYGAQATNIHVTSQRKFEFDGNGDFSIVDGNLKVASGHGIDFSATADGTGSSQAELLDDYEEGSWTPAVASGNASFSTMIGRYTKVGNMVTIWCRIAGGGSYSGSGLINISGIPFTNSTPFNPIGTAEYYKILFGSGFSDHCTPYLAGNNLQWLRNGSSGGSGNYLTADLFYSGAAIQTTLQYITTS